MLIFKVPVENPTAPPKRIIAAPVIESKPIAIESITITGAKAIKVFTACVVQIRANTKVKIEMNKYNFSENRFPIFAIIACKAPVSVKM